MASKEFVFSGLIKNYWQERTQIVKYKQHRSIEKNVTTAVPQGSILVPLLFLLYINDIESCSDIPSFVLYADDTNVFYSNSCLKSLYNAIQNEMNKVVKWLNANKLSINSSKTKFVIFKSRNKSLLNTDNTIKINIIIWLSKCRL
jgi:hypothetical protein